MVASAAPDRATYLTRPDLGRVPEERGLDRIDHPDGTPDLTLVVADGLSAEAVAKHAVPLLEHLLPLLDGAMTIAAPVVGTQARVALGDHVGRALGARLVLVLIGERPGLSSSDSLGAYLTWDPRPGIFDSARNCVSNIRPPHGLDHATAARTIASLVAGARELGATGVALVAVVGAVITLPALWGVGGIPLAFYAITSVAVIGLYLAFAIPIFLRWRAGDSFETGQWNLGRHYKWLNLVAVAEIAVISVYFILPFVPSGWITSDDFSWKSVNYAPILTVGSLVVLAIWWTVSARTWFTGPKTTLD